MSTRRLLNITTGAVAILLVGAAILSWNGGRGAIDSAVLELAAGQPAALAELQRDARDLASAADLADVNAARERLGASILRFDRTLSALVNGGTVARPDGTTVRVEPQSDQAVRATLSQAVGSWRRIGVPLADLAAGAFSAYSAAGQSALKGLEDGRPALDHQLSDLDTALQAAASDRSGRARSVRSLAVGLAALLAGLLLLRRLVKTPAGAPVARAAPAGVPAPEAPVTRPLAPRTARPAAPPLPAVAPAAPLRPYTSPVDLEDVSLAVDRLAVDMNAIATNSDKMRAAIDSVGHALHGMLFSLKEMAKDTAEGERLVGGVHSAASYTRDVADALTASVREMSTVVANVANLANRTRETADRIAADTAHGERTGQGFTPAMSNEIRGLAQHTGAATAEIEETVSAMLATTREYEEAIGEILKHVSAINKVSQDLGRVMLDPPAPEVVPAPSLAPAAAPMVDEVPEEDLSEMTAAAIADATDALEGVAEDATAEPVAEVQVEEPVDEPPTAAGETPVEPVIEEEAPAETITAEEAPVAEEPAPVAFSLDPEGSEPVPAAEPSEAPTVFMLSKPAVPAEETEPEPAVAAEPEFAAEPEITAEPEAMPEPEADLELESSAVDVVVGADPDEFEAALEDPIEPVETSEPEEEPEAAGSGNLSFFT